MAWTNIVQYKTRLRFHPDDTLIASPKPLHNDMPLPPVPFITPSGLVTFQHDLKARISSSPLLKVPLTMRPLIKKRSSLPFSLSLKRHSSTIFSRSASSSSDASSSVGSTPTLELVDPMSTSDVPVAETTLHITPSIGAKIVDRFWPEEEDSCSEESYSVSVPSHYPAALAPPPHHRRALRSLGAVREVHVGDHFSPRTCDEHNTGPLRFPF